MAHKEKLPSVPWDLTEVNQPCTFGFQWHVWIRRVVTSLISYPSTRYKIHDFASGGSGSVATKKCYLLTLNGVSLNGSLYWVVYYESDPLLVLFYFDFLEERFVLHCDLPFERKHNRDAFALRVFGGDRLSLFKQCHLSKKVEIWVTKNKILKGEYDKNLEWIKFMEVSNPNFPDLVQTGSKSQPSYFIEDKKLVVCSCDETGQAWIYVAVD